ncbi:MAG: CPBP family intramembrane glutamic endopeptidase, partial [Aestuariivirgaceae bacterium]
ALVGGSSLVFIGAFYALAHVRKGGSPANVLLLRPSGLWWWQYLLVAAVMIGVVIGSLNVISIVTGASEAEFEVGIEYMKDLVSGSGWLNWLLIISVVVIAGPITEEIVFRGFLFTTLVKTPVGFIGAAAISSVLWTVLHYQYNWQVLLALFIFGVGLSYVVWRTGSLWPGIFAHSANNLASALILLMR